MARSPGSFDHRNFYRDGEKPNRGATEQAENRWWAMTGEADIANAVTSTLNTLRKAQDIRARQYVVNGRMYGGRPVAGYAAQWFPRATGGTGGAGSGNGASSDQIRYNVTQSVTDTLISNMISNHPKPMYVTNGGDYRLRKKGERLNEFTEGVFYECNTYRKGIEALKDGCIQGDGLLKIMINPDTQRIEHDRVDTMEIYVDEVEAEFGQPRTMHHVKLVDRTVAEDLWPNKLSWIRDAQKARVTDAGQPSISDLIAVRESWRLPSSPGAKDGRHVLTIDGHSLGTMEPWAYDFFPFARFRYCTRPRGYWSQGIAEQLRPIQREIDQILWLIQQSIHMAGTFKILMKIGSQTPTEHFNNMIGTIIKYAGDAPPTYITPPIVQPELYTHLWNLVQKAYDLSGISALSASGQMPPGLSGSGEAQRVYNNIETKRFQNIGKSWEEFFMEVSRISVALLRDAAKENKGSYPVQTRGKHGLAVYDWKDIALEEDDYRLECYPVSALPSEPAGRIAMVEDWMRIGLITDPTEAARLMEFPDLKQVGSLMNAQTERLSKILDKIIEDAEYTAPDPYDNQAEARKTCLEYLKRAQTEAVEPEKIDMLEAFLQQLDWIASQATPPPALPPMIPGAGRSTLPTQTGAPVGAPAPA